MLLPFIDYLPFIITYPLLSIYIYVIYVMPESDIRLIYKTDESFFIWS